MDVAERFFKDAATTTASSEDSFHRSYLHFINFFASHDILTEHDIVIGCFFTYGWMPTILDLRGDLEPIVSTLNRVKLDGHFPNSEELQELASCINGSAVGASKLLHFIRPDLHAIWDSRVYRYLYQKQPHPYRLKAPGAYRNYLEIVKELSEDNRTEALKVRLEEEIGYPVSRNRIIEYVMFFNGVRAK